jgi:hypothetical protein
MHSKRSSWNCITRIWIRSRARLSARREKSSSGGASGEGRAVARLCATGLGAGAVEASKSEIRRKSRIVKITSAAQFTATARGSKDGGQKH